MPAKTSDRTAILRLALEAALGKMTEPVSSATLTNHPEMVSMEASSNEVSQELSWLYRRKKPPFPLARIHANGGDNTQYAYYRPDVVKLDYKQKLASVAAELKEREKTAAAADDAQSAPPHPVEHKAPEFEFNPVEFEPVADVKQDVAKPVVPVTVPPGVKSVTITVGGVSIRVDMGS